MTINIDGCNVNYVQYGKKSGKDVVLLHGWGQNIAMMEPVGNGISDMCHITILDLPGFGESSEPEKDFTILDYYNILDKLLVKLKIKNPILIGHSFGGRIAIYYASKKKVEKLMLFSVPFVKRITKPTLKMKLLKTLKKIPGIRNFEDFAKKHIGSRDYKAASPIMRKTLVNAVNLDLVENVKNIKCPLICIAGEDDLEVSLDEMMLYKDYVSDCEVIVYKNMSHYAYLEDLNRTNAIARAFIGGN